LKALTRNQYCLPAVRPLMVTCGLEVLPNIDQFVPSLLTSHS
jgi:hypothetical protein